MAEEQQTSETTVQKPEQNNTEIEKEMKTEEIKLGKQKIAEDSKLKILPVINATEITEVKKDEEVNCTEIINGWVCIENDNKKGWIRQGKIKNEEVENSQTAEQEEQKEEEQQNQNEEENKQEQQAQATTKTLFVNTTTINLRKDANTTSEVITTLPVNTAVEVVEESNGWCRVKVSGKEGYISASLLSDKKQETSRAMETPRKVEENKQQETSNVANTVATTTNSVNSSGTSVVDKAKSYIGSSYVYGGSSPSGFDCSGFTSYIYKQYGINLNRTASGQYSNGTAVDRSNLQPGDLIMFGKSGINHVGIYIGDGKMVHAANPSRGVTTDTINSGYYNTNYVGARRVIN